MNRILYTCLLVLASLFTAQAQTKPAKTKKAQAKQAQTKAPEAKPAQAAAAAKGPEAKPAEAKEPADGEMKIYYMAILKKGPNRTHDELTAARIQDEHMAHINKMAADGKLTMAGPFMDDGEMRGIFIFNVKSLEEAKALTEADPAVKAGRLIMELHPWYSMKGAKLQ
ncbi:YciI family protein [Nibribacter koreensis]|uniref:YCII-related domain-containing protein n=1 Tax=Nibribacter koreensis TaxID=1084519 RepID=A0ABP8FRY3_9BACT